MTVTFSKTGLVNATIRDEEGERVGTVSVRSESFINEIMEIQEDARRYRAIGHTPMVVLSAKQMRDLKACVDAGRGNADIDAYMHGYANGLILALSIVEGTKPDFIDMPAKKEQPLRATGSYKPEWWPTTELGSDGPTEAEPLDAYRDSYTADRAEQVSAAVAEAYAKERDALAFVEPSKDLVNAAKLVLAVFDVAVEIAETQAQTVERARAMDKLRALTGKRS